MPGIGKASSHFQGYQYTGEILRVTCEKEISLEWLNQTVSSLTPLWEAAQLNVALAEIPRLMRTTLWISELPVDAEIVLRRLEIQNRWARVKKCLLFHHEAKPEAASPGNLFVFGLGMDEAKTRHRLRKGRTQWKRQKPQGMKPLPAGADPPET
ncbi:hypothetical protein Zmor_018426 [Zophobas morio]|uniref:DUF4780 domain-containing protein n=1 Tax=Zophobas morio TaxID=2755281 RepID=A0AA38IBG8_9CUCU|nr:hypothetical protein Zmor_018426 [Zophobas morio]